MNGRTSAYLVPPGSLAGRLATAATAEGGQRKQQRRRRWLEGLLRPPYWRGPFLSPCGPHCCRGGWPPVLSRSVREDAAHRQRRHSCLLMPPLAPCVASSCASRQPTTCEPLIATAGFLHPLRRHHHLRLPQRPLLSLPAYTPAYSSNDRSYLSLEFFQRTDTVMTITFFVYSLSRWRPNDNVMNTMLPPIVYITELSSCFYNAWLLLTVNENQYFLFILHGDTVFHCWISLAAASERNKNNSR